MHKSRLFFVTLIAGFLASLLGGCATTRDVHQFKPLPVASVRAGDLAPEAPRAASELLKAAGDALKSANTAHEKGDVEAASRYYNMVFELLMEADLDPTVYYKQKSQLARLLDATAEQAPRFARFRERKEGEFPSVYGEIVVPLELPRRVEQEVQEIQKVYPKGYQAGLNRSTRYLPYICKELRKAGLPEDLAWLAMVESQFTPKIVSPAGAGGMWQFMRSTARRYGLRMDYYVDERYDWQKATKAAIAYLRELYEMFDWNWPYAVSAYNMGEYGLERTIAAAGGERDLWALLEMPQTSNYMRQETRKFYAKLLATIVVARNPERYGFSQSLEPADSTVRVPVKGCYSLRALNEACGLPADTLKRLNPEYIRGVTPPQGSYGVAVPTDKADTLVTALKKVPELKYTSYTGPDGVHIVRPRETPSQIAKLYGVSTKELMRVNRIQSARTLQVGQRLLVPGKGKSTGSVEVDTSGRTIYTVRRGDSLGLIAKRHGVSVKNLQSWNGLGSKTRIYTGQKLFVTAPGAATATHTGPGSSQAGQKVVHIVRSNEYPAKIARQYGVDLDDFLKWNNLTRRSMIRVGQKLTVYTHSGKTVPDQPATGTGTPSGAVPGNALKRIHKVSSGENPWIIAEAYGVPVADFLKWNGLSESSVLHIGDECVLYLAGEGATTEPSTKSATAETAGEKILHTVSKGQNPTTIARRYGVKVSDLFRWNGWEKTPVLHIGTKVIVYKKN